MLLFYNGCLRRWQWKQQRYRRGDRWVVQPLILKSLQKCCLKAYVLFNFQFLVNLEISGHMPINFPKLTRLWNVNLSRVKYRQYFFNKNYGNKIQLSVWTRFQLPHVHCKFVAKYTLLSLKTDYMTQQLLSWVYT